MTLKALCPIIQNQTAMGRIFFLSWILRKKNMSNYFIEISMSGNFHVLWPQLFIAFFAQLMVSGDQAYCATIPTFYATDFKFSCKLFKKSFSFISLEKYVKIYFFFSSLFRWFSPVFLPQPSLYIELWLFLYSVFFYRIRIQNLI